MKITHIILENYAAIKNAMNTNRIEIDFSNSKNNVCLIIGPNGSGKTTLLSLLNPFATIGNLDIRDGLGLILDGKNGYKEISYQSGHDFYTIKHFYTPQKDRSHSVKSYIEKNGAELNPNGNVTSFKEIVKEELDIELDYLKLIRLGSNVTNMLDLSETERKNYMSKLLDDIGIYLSYYKKVNNDIRQLKDMISHLIDKINKLNIDSPDDVSKEIEELDGRKLSLQKDIYRIIGDLSVFKSQIDAITDVENLKTNLSKNLHTLNRMKSVLEKKSKYSDTDLESIKKKIEEIQVDIQKYKSNTEACEVIIRHMNDTLESDLNQYHRFEILLEQEKNVQDEIDSLESEKRKCEDDIAFSKQEIAGFDITVSKEDFENFIIFLKNIQDMLNTTYEYGRRPIQKVISLLKKNKNVTSYIVVNSSMVQHDDNLNIFIHKLRALSITDNDFDDPNLPCDPSFKCKFRQLAIQIRNIISNEHIEPEVNQEFIHDMDIVWNVLNKVIELLKEKSDIINTLPTHLKNEFLSDTIFKKLGNLEPIYNNEMMNEYLSILTAHDFIRTREADLASLNTQIQFRKNGSNLDSIVASMKELSNRINETKDTINMYHTTIHDNQECISSLSKELESMEEWYESCTQFDMIRNQQESLEHDFEIYSKAKSQITILDKSMEEKNYQIQDIERQIESRKANLLYYADYSKELNKYSKIYDDMVFIKDALSSKKGIPLHYMSLYLGNTEEITNELLDIAYDGDIYIDKFNITPTEFTIPFYNKGTLIRDVKYASQGELSFLSIALSFALSTQSMKKYNIMLLDEIDGPLDKSNRVKFVSILENQIDRISSEQNFLITHNDMFNGYPIDILDLSFEDNQSQYPLSTIIPIKKG